MDNGYITKKFYSKISRLHLPLISLIFIVCCYGLCVLYAIAGENIHPWAYKQFLNIIFCAPIAIFVAFLDLKTIYQFAWVIYLAVLVMLVVVELLGYTAMGATRWLNLGFIKIQPSEPAKLAIIIALARCFSNIEHRNVNRFIYLSLLACIVIIPTALVIKQPDLGTGIIILVISSCVFFAAGVGIWKFITLGGSIILLSPIIWNFLRDYQKKRIMVFLNPEMDPKGAGYNIIQSKIAIGSGGFWGKGLGEGTQSQLSFLPEYETDFIFAALAEDFGFLGCMLLIAIYALIIYISTTVAINAKSVFGKLLALGVTAMFTSHVFINMGMVMGLLPAVGVPLPFISYGGTMIGTMLVGFGIILNVHINQSIDIKR
ncbi:MAG: hypothetical protein RLZZ59_476 [Pseudomonadota bacterium]|jgi:rod shape determining protein RodA